MSGLCIRREGSSPACYIAYMSTTWRSTLQGILRDTHPGWAQVVKGADVVLIIERSKTDKNDKPFEDIKIMNISVQGEAA